MYMKILISQKISPKIALMNRPISLKNCFKPQYLAIRNKVTKIKIM